MPPNETYEESSRAPRIPAAEKPGVVVVFAAGKPFVEARVISGSGLEVGREEPFESLRDDERISRKHLRLTFKKGAFEISDLGSRNGTFIGERRLEGTELCSGPGILRVGRSLLWLVNDTTPFLGESAWLSSGPDAPVIGGKLRAAWGEIALAGRAGDTLLIRGESGSGKELAARAFHTARHAASGSAPFVAVNCAAIPEGLAERLLFGARRGAFSGATADAEGYVQAAHGGTLFLDEIAELDPLVQAKLLRVLETREVLPLGASSPRRVQISVCAASHRDLREEVRAQRFREDLYYRIGRPELCIPPLRERLDEIPRYVDRELASVDARLSPSVGFVEACLRREWPGNVRELLKEVRHAAHAALARAATQVDAEDLAKDAGVPLGAPSAAAEAPMRAPPPDDERIARALAENGGNVRGTARALGMHRNQLRRWLEKHPEAVASGPDEE